MKNPIPYSPRQMEVLRLVKAGWTEREIAHELGLSKRTVEKHKEWIRRKAGVNKTALAELA